MSQVVEDRLTAGREAFERHQWEVAFEHLRAADADSSLAAEDLERLAESARWSRHYTEMLDAFERAYGAFEGAGNQRGAARVAFQLCVEHYYRRNDAVVAGWFAQVARLVDGHEDWPEHGLMLWGSARIMADQGQLEGARELLERADDLGRRLRDPNVLALTRLTLGHLRIIAGEPREGFALIDEATALAMGGGVALWASGNVYCATIWACRNIGDWRRAAEWTDASTRWCERQAVSGFPGLCRFHRAEIKRVRGAFDAAEEDALEAIEELRVAIPRDSGFGYGELGEIRRRRGDRAGAAEAFRQALDAGYDPQPGRALLQLDEGDTAGALRAINRALQDENALAQEGRAFLLPAQATIAVAAGDLDVARGAIEELQGRADASGTAAFDAAAAGASGELALAEGRTSDAQGDLRRAWQRWCEVDAPYEAARTRLLLGRAYQAEGDEKTAKLELEAAHSTFERIGAVRAATEIATELEPAARGERSVRTFLFTDIVDSTRFVDLLGDESWESLLAWHDRTLRAAFAEHHGEEVKHEGDGFFVAFADAGAAIECACAIQRALADHRRDHGFAPQVRCGVHTAEATERGGDYAGKGVHAAARIGAAAGAGEVLVSRAALDAAGDGFNVVDERTLELKGLAAPVPVAGVDRRSR